MSYHVGEADAVRNAGTLIRAGAQAVKLEGGRKRLPVVHALLDAEIPVMGHLGLTPQSLHAMGGFKVQGKDARGRPRPGRRRRRRWPRPGASPSCSRACPTGSPRMVTETIDVPTIGIGAGALCDGQVLVFHDVAGLEDRVLPKFVRRYGSLKAEGVAAIGAFAADVRARRFPSDAESYHLAGGIELDGDIPALYGDPAVAGL